MAIVGDEVGALEACVAPLVGAGKGFDLWGREFIRTDTALDARSKSVMPHNTKRGLGLTSVVEALSACAVVVVSLVYSRVIPRSQGTRSWSATAPVEMIVVMLSRLLRITR